MCNVAVHKSHIIPTMFKRLKTLAACLGLGLFMQGYVFAGDGEIVLHHKASFFTGQNNIWYTFFNVGCKIKNGTIQPTIEETKNLHRWSWNYFTINAKVQEVVQQQDKLQIIVNVKFKGLRNAWTSVITQVEEISTWGPTENTYTRDSMTVMFEYLYKSYPELLKVKKYNTQPFSTETHGEYFPAGCSEKNIDKRMYVEVFSTKGNARIRTSGAGWNKLDPFMELQYGDSVATENTTFQVYLKDKGMLKVGYNTLFTVEERAENFRQYTVIKVIKGYVEAYGLRDENVIKIMTSEGTFGAYGDHFGVRQINGQTLLYAFEDQVYFKNPVGHLNIVEPHLQMGISNGITETPHVPYITGTYETSMGLLTLFQLGKNVTGSFHKVVGKDKITGKVEGILDGDLFNGVWSKSPSYKGKHDAGLFKLSFSGDGGSFDGMMSIGENNKTLDQKWSGKRKD